MKIITLREHIKSEIASFLRPLTHSLGTAWADRMQTQREAFARLDPETATMEDLDTARSAFGAKAARLVCDECGEPREVLIRFGEEPDYEARWQDLCVNCLAEGEAKAATPVQPIRDDG